MKLKEGKRYVRRDGKTSGIIEHNPFNHEYPFMDPDNNNSYTTRGKRVSGCKHDSDLIAVYKESDTKVIAENEVVHQVDTVTISRKDYERFIEMEKFVKMIATEGGEWL